MANKIVELINKGLKPVIEFIGKQKLKSENLVGVVLGDTDIQICTLIKKKGEYTVDQFSYQNIAGIGKDQDIFTASTYLSDQVKNALSSVKLKTTDVSLSLNNNIVQTFNLQIPLMDENDLKESVELGGFWEQFDQTPETMEGFETSYKVLGSNEEMGVMDIVLYAAETKLIEAYVNIFRLAGLNPVIVDINSNNQFNALSVAFSKEGFEEPVAIFNYTKESSYVAVTSVKGFSYLEMSIVEADQVLLDTIEEVEDVLNEFWDEIFQRVASQIQQACIEFETQHETDPIKLLNIFTDKRKIKNFCAGMQKQLGEDFVIKEYDPEESITFGSDATKFIDSLPNKSLTASAMGAAIRKVNAFEIQDATDEFFNFNFLPRFNQLKINRKSKTCGKFFLITGLVILFLGLGHVVPFKVLPMLENNSVISKNQGDLDDVEQKEKLLKVYQAKLDKRKKDTKTLKAMGQNKKTSTEVIESLVKIVPENIRLISFEIEDKRRLIIEGVTKDDVSVTNMVNAFTKENTVEEAKLAAFANLTEKDIPKIYDPVKGRGDRLKKDELPKEDITKKFSLEIVMKPTEGEVFDNEKVIDKMLKAGKKRARKKKR